MNNLPFTLLFLVLCFLFQPPLAGAQPSGSATIGFCNHAVSLGKGYIEAMENIDRQRLEAGDVLPAEHAATLAQLAAQSQTLSITQCMNGQGEQLAFYQCLVNHSGKIPNCLP